MKSQLAGFSDKINNPSFNKYRKASKQWSLLFASILAFIAIVAFPVYGRYSGEIDWPGSLFYGICIGAMFIVIALLQTLKRNRDKTWDGEVLGKQTYRQKERLKNGRLIYHTVYIMRVRIALGGVKKHKWIDNPGLYNYYSIGDLVRHHKEFYYYEKLDKSIDLQILCIACNSLVDINLDSCPRCHCPLLK